MKLPRVIRSHYQSHQAELELELPPELLWFEGHFPGHPVLPGVVQIHWALHFATSGLGVAGQFLALERVKFQQLVLPGSRLHLQLEHLADAGQLLFHYRNDEGSVASGRIDLGPAP
ncbi:3-hydroxyacyl-ACP dehydratase FabZ family protein [Aestuariirhabdus litorea]|uniref:Hydroxymyristoyl-ACP dehydratase n=1 Tax=Aestuariirhabdus litorea TaxID=2528527 RepID=A0A3P3VM36_9GAMM|nr:hydroxymyristoyl-ACP dehydratase [Aestuariirhabdus litorea]RRJ82779.1 hydroxymyristoyl-ACP dehydratase [Aestuariirhabdus litorea]RWW92939.1 hydroxymyristoyl-ACP dehydratase [Endozoicomonadaceae bacterium GTF-13]